MTFFMTTPVIEQDQGFYKVAHAQQDAGHALKPLFRGGSKDERLKRPSFKGLYDQLRVIKTLRGLLRRPGQPAPARIDAGGTALALLICDNDV